MLKVHNQKVDIIQINIWNETVWKMVGGKQSIIHTYQFWLPVTLNKNHIVN